MRDVLEDILETKRSALKAAKEKAPFGELEREVRHIKRGSRFSAAIHRENKISLIAEMKRKSPSEGLLRDPYDPCGIAAAYEKGGAAALSILTESGWFGGDIDDIRRVCKTSPLPILRKDFIFDPYQIVEAKAAGADAILLIADMLDQRHMLELAAAAKEFNIEVLVEVFTTSSVEAALETQSSLIGINTRNLRTLELKPNTIDLICPLIPKDRILVAESGIKTAEDVIRLRKFPIQAMLVGESLLKKPDLENAARELAEAGK